METERGQGPRFFRFGDVPYPDCFLHVHVLLLSLPLSIVFYSIPLLYNLMFRSIE